MPFPTLLTETPCFPLNSGEQAHSTYLSRDSEIARSPRTAHVEIRSYRGVWWGGGSEAPERSPIAPGRAYLTLGRGCLWPGTGGSSGGRADIYGRFI